ncbi:Protein kinase domain family protein [Candida albicans]|uniref:Mitogen-activated protein kinase MKC1 n=1 Tax=Candida albicans TaxID=5476 RepID=A0A8H6C593_CANAX|nr:Protein kinase domain family protein [Candida albicans]
MDQQEAPIYYGRSVNKVYNQEFIIDSRFKIVKELGHGAYGIVCSAKYDNGSKKFSIQTTFNEIYLYEELMECDMHQIIRSGQPLSDQHYQSFIYQVLCGLNFIHSADVLHRDLKPGNLLVNADCELKICDFGLARGFSENPDENAGFMTEYVATRWYRAPEIMLSFTNYTKAIDIWSVGCILAELLGGKPLFRGKDYVDQLNQILMILGTPPESTLQRIGSHRAQNYVRSLPITRKASYEELFPDANPLALDLLERMLTLDPRERITVRDALNHKYLELWHDPKEEIECQVKFDFKSFETVDGLDEMKQLIMDEVQKFREFLHMQKREEQRQEEEEKELLEQQRQFPAQESMDISQTPYNNLETNIGTPQVEDDYPRPQELDEFTFSNLESSSSMNLFQDMAKPSGEEYIKLEEELGFGLDGAMFNNYCNDHQ